MQDALRDPEGFVDAGAARSAGQQPAMLLQWWRDGRAALDAGVTLIQLREKELAARDYFTLAEKARALAWDRLAHAE